MQLCVRYLNSRIFTQYIVPFVVVLGRIVLVIGELTKNNPHKITIYCMILKYFINILHY